MVIGYLDLDKYKKLAETYKDVLFIEESNIWHYECNALIEIAAKIDWYTVLKKRKGQSEYKPIQQIKNGIIIASFQSINEAARKTGLWASAIRLVAYGKLNHTGGYQWKFIKEKINA